MARSHVAASEAAGGRHAGHPARRVRRAGVPAGPGPGRASLPNRTVRPAPRRGPAATTQLARRGWRNFVTAEAMDAEVHGDRDRPRQRPSTASGSGAAPSSTVGRAPTAPAMLDLRIPNPGLTPGWHEVTAAAPRRSEPTSARVLVVDDDAPFGIVSDLDDTVIRTYLPTAADRGVQRLRRVRGLPHGRCPGWPGSSARCWRGTGAPTFYVSTGAWNTAPMLGRFLARNGFPRGPLLLTDWGPTNSGLVPQRQGAQAEGTAGAGGRLPGDVVAAGR